MSKVQLFKVSCICTFHLSLPDTLLLYSCINEGNQHINFLFLHTQAQEYLVAVYIVGFVIGVAPLCVTVMSPLVGYFVSTIAELRKLISLLLILS